MGGGGGWRPAHRHGFAMQADSSGSVVRAAGREHRRLRAYPPAGATTTASLLRLVALQASLPPLIASHHHAADPAAARGPAVGRCRRCGCLCRGILCASINIISTTCRSSVLPDRPSITSVTLLCLLCAAARAYSCDESACKSPDCMCPSTKPPGGLSPKDIPQFVLISVSGVPGWCEAVLLHSCCRTVPGLLRRPPLHPGR